jgi:carboxymethylenebutenolidase
MSGMCFPDDARPPLPPIRGAAIDAGELTLSARDGTAVPAYGARAGEPTGAGIVVVPDVRGLHPYYEELVLRFAEAGVDAVAVDLFGRTAADRRRGEGFDHEPHVMQLTSDGVMADVAAGVDHLRSADGGAPERIYSTGFCLGGRISFLQAAAGLGLAGVSGLYGWPVGPHRTGLPAPADEAPRFACPVLAIYGGADQGIPADARDAFSRALDNAGVEHRTIVYDGAPHSFFDRKATDYADASDAAWRELLAFMRGSDTAAG